MSGAGEQSLSRQRSAAGVRARLARFMERRGYAEVSTPIIEPTDLFLKKSGGELAAQMYSFTDPSGRPVSLRPEFTSSVALAFAEGRLPGPLPQRWQYAGTVFRRESGGEFDQFGAELIGAGSAAADAEILALAAQGLAVLGVSGLRLRIGHVGVAAALYDALGLSERSRVFLLKRLAALQSGEESPEGLRASAERLGLLSPRAGERSSGSALQAPPDDADDAALGLGGQASRRAAGQRTTEEILRRYARKLRQADDPGAFDRAIALSGELARSAGPADRARERLGRVASRYGAPASALAPLNDLLDALAMYDLRGTPAVVDIALARGLAYYTGVVFDVERGRGAARRVIGGGGRCDELVRALGGKRGAPAAGFALALDAVAEALPPGYAHDDGVGAPQVLVTAQEGAMSEAVATAERLRAQGIPAELDLENASDAAAARYAQRRGIETIMRVGQDGRAAERLV